MRTPGSICSRILLVAVAGTIFLLSGCDSGGGGGGGRFVPNDTKIEKVNGLSPSEAFHKGGSKR